MTIHRFALTISHCRLRSIGVATLALGLLACSSDGTGLKQIDGGAATKTDSLGVESGLGQGGAGGSVPKLDAATKTDTVLVGSGGASAGGASGTGATGATSTGGVKNPDGGTSTGGVLSGSGGSAGLDAAGTFGTGGTTEGAGGNTGRDAGLDTPTAMDVPLALDGASQDTAIARDSKIFSSDAVTMDGAVACGEVDEPCCEQRTCNSPTTICTSGGAGSGGICVACGGDGEACCAGDTCTAPGTTCSGGGRGGGTCR